jgi:hypothetical protein
MRQRGSDYHPCFAMRLGGVSGGKETQWWRDCSHTAMVGAGKFGSANTLRISTATEPVEWRCRALAKCGTEAHAQAEFPLYASAVSALVARRLYYRSSC